MRLRVADIAIVILCALLMQCCSSARHVPDGELLLRSVDIDIEGDNRIERSDLTAYLRQLPNHKILGSVKLALGVYNMSGADTTRWYNRWIRSIGEAPVIYDRDLAAQSQRQLQLALVNRGYNHAVVTVDSVVDGKKIDLTYRITPGRPHVVDTLCYIFDDPEIESIVLSDSSLLSLRRGSLLNRDLLEAERTGITNRLRNRGYYTFSKDYITFIADTTAGSQAVGLTMHIHNPSASDSASRHLRYTIYRVVYNLADGDTDCDTVSYHDITIIYGRDRYLRPSVLEEKCFIHPGEPYRTSAINRTYEALSQLGIVKYINIAVNPIDVPGEPNALEAVISMSRTRKQSVSFEVDGTNSEGDLGFGVSLTYQHRNLAHGSELLTAKFRTSYESLSGNLEGLINDRYTEFAGEVGITLPKLQAPLLSKSFKQRVKASTEFAFSMSYQERPEYTRIISGLAWKYRWNYRANTIRHTFDFLDITYVNLPRSTIDFINTVAPSNPLLRYSYEDHLIMRIGYTFYRTNRRPVSATRLTPMFQSNIYTLRASVETAGNVLYALSEIDGAHRHDGAYKVFGTPFSQYAKVDFDYTYVHNFSHRHSIAFHAGAGVGVPYGNSSMIPFEKRFYAGGANSVRGWSVRTLGPGSYDSRNSVTDFINQCGDIRLDLNMEYRAKLFWVLEGALFIDAGNIWTIRNYENQPGGVFRPSEFYKQIAAAYGMGIRLDFTYFLLRLDLGMKAHNPAQGQEPWPLLHPRWGRDRTIHFSIGYPF